MSQQKANTKKANTKTQNDYKMKKIARMEAKKLIDAEVEDKFYSDYNYGVNISTAGTVINFTVPIAQGTGENQRVGDSITPKFLQIKGYLYGQGYPAIARVIVGQFKGGVNSNSPSVATLLEFSGTAALITSPYLEKYRHSYRILHDKVYTTSATLSYNGDIIRPFKVAIPANKLIKSRYDNAGNMTGGSLWMVVVSDQPLGNYPQLFYSSKLWYQDA